MENINFGWHLIQLLTLIIVTFVGKSFQHLLNEIKDLRKEVHEEHERFKEYMSADRCESHRQYIEERMMVFEQALKTCCRKKDCQSCSGMGDGIG